MLSTSEGKGKKGEMGAVGNSCTWTGAGEVPIEMEDNAPIVRGDSDDSAHPSAYPSCCSDPLALAPSLILHSPSTIRDWLLDFGQVTSSFLAPGSSLSVRELDCGDAKVLSSPTWF